MKTSRLEAFSDGVLAIIITIMVLELQAPKEVTLNALLQKAPTFISYIVSFIYLGIYWNNHHHLFQVTEKVNGKILWVNLHLLFWLSLIPFATAWIGEKHIETVPIAFYGFILLMASIAYSILETTIIKNHNEDFLLRKVVGNKWKEKLSVFIYIIGLIVCFFIPVLAVVCYVIVPFLWLIPSKIMEQEM